MPGKSDNRPGDPRACLVSSRIRSGWAPFEHICVAIVSRRNTPRRNQDVRSDFSRNFSASRDTGALASSRLSLLLALEVTIFGRPAADRGGAARVDPADEHGKPSLGRATHPRQLLKLWFEIAQSSVAKYMVKRRGPPGQGWLTFLRNHAQISPPWTCSLFPLSVLTCSMHSSSSD